MNERDTDGDGENTEKMCLKESEGVIDMDSHVEREGRKRK